MSKLSKKRFLENHSSFPNFHKKVLEQGDVEWKLLKENPQDYYAANSGKVHKQKGCSIKNSLWLIIKFK